MTQVYSVPSLMKNVVCYIFFQLWCRKTLQVQTLKYFLIVRILMYFFIPTEMRPHVFHQAPKTLLHKVVFCVKGVLFGVQTVKIRGFLPDYLSKYYT